MDLALDKKTQELLSAAKTLLKEGSRFPKTSLEELDGVQRLELAILDIEFP
jgi:hypothetical protein